MDGSGPGARLPVLALLRLPTSDTVSCWNTGRPASAPTSTTPPLTGYDSDHELAEGEVGRLGVAIDTVRDMGDLFHEIPLDRVSVSLTINHPSIVLLSMFLAVGERAGS